MLWVRFPTRFPHLGKAWPGIPGTLPPRTLSPGRCCPIQVDPRWQVHYQVFYDFFDFTQAGVAVKPGC